MSNMKIISILDHDQRQQEQRVRADLDAAIVHVDDEIQSVRREMDVAMQRIRNRLQDLTLRVTVLEGVPPGPNV